MLLFVSKVYECKGPNDPKSLFCQPQLSTTDKSTNVAGEHCIEVTKASPLFVTSVVVCNGVTLESRVKVATEEQEGL